jgi:S-DNA-T family DNA segregation ATPase FtsK/SpoIIIE
VTDVPVTLDLAALGVVGLVGSTADTTALASSLVVQAACLHSPADLAIVAATAPRRHPAGWLAWLPHTRSGGSPLPGPHLATTGTGAGALLAALVAECDRRLGPGTPRQVPLPPNPSAPAPAGTAPPSRPPGSPGPRADPRLLVLLDRALDPDPALVSRLLDTGPAAGLSVLWLSDEVATVPRQARTVVECRSPLSGRPSRIVATDPDVADRDIDLDRLGPEPAAATARALAPLHDATSVDAADPLPEIEPLFATLGVGSIDADTVAERWAVEPGRSLRGTIGRAESGPLVLDLVEHGPHALVGGTSGSGKSELLMSLVAGLVADNPPTRVTFLFIDYKGGASSDPFRRIPHAVGHVTNLDRLASLRALTSLRAELDRRMNLLQGRAKDLAELRERSPEDAPPSLVIVVDEFATLVREIPDFVTGIVDVAQRGRSLGIHLILATQRPSGSVNDNITANTNLRIALRMLDGSESRAVIGSPEAAAIPTSLRGRAYARLGAGEPVAFQSAWSGAPLPAEAGPRPVVATRFGMGTPAEGPEPGPGPCRPAPIERTQIDALLDAVVCAAARSGLGPGRPPWLDPLPAVIPLAEVRSGLVPAPGPGLRIAIGMVDDPEAQAQYPAVVDLDRSGGLLVAGTGGSGKSTLLVTAAVSAALDDADRGGGGLTVFAIDAAARALVGLRHLPQCAAVATVDDLEALTRVIDVLDRELDRRRAARAEAVIRPAAGEEAPPILLLIDGLEAVLQVMEQGPAAVTLAPHQIRLTRLLTDGRQVGIHPVVATTRWPAVPAAVGSAIAGRLTLRQADAQGYAEAGIPASRAAELDLRPGQGFLGGARLVQIACLDEGGGAGEAREAGPTGEPLAALARSLGGRVDPRLATAPLPRQVPLLPSDPDRPLRPVVGLADLTGEPYALDLTNADLSVLGDPRSGRSTALATIGAQGARAGVEVWALARPGSPLAAVAASVHCCTDEGGARIGFLEELADRVAEPTDRPRLLLLDDHDLLPEHDRAVLAPLERILGSIRWVAAGGRPRGFSGGAVAQLVRGARSLVHLRPHDPREAHELLGVAPPWHPGLPMVEGRGLVVVDRVVTMIQFSDPTAG